MKVQPSSDVIRGGAKATDSRVARRPKSRWNNEMRAEEAAGASTAHKDALASVRRIIVAKAGFLKQEGCAGSMLEAKIETGPDDQTG